MRKFKIYTRTKRPELEYPKPIGEYVDYTIHQEKKSTGEGVDDFEIIDVIDEHRVNIQEFINSFNDKAGIDSIMRIVSATGDLSLLNQVEEIHYDTTIIPKDPEEALKLAKSVEEAFENIDPELIENQTMEEFIKSLTPEKLKAYIDRKVAEKTAKEKKEDESGK